MPGMMKKGAAYKKGGPVKKYQAGGAVPARRAPVPDIKGSKPANPPQSQGRIPFSSNVTDPFAQAGRRGMPLTPAQTPAVTRMPAGGVQVGQAIPGMRTASGAPMILGRVSPRVEPAASGGFRRAFDNAGMEIPPEDRRHPDNAAAMARLMPPPPRPTPMQPPMPPMQGRLGSVGMPPTGPAPIGISQLTPEQRAQAGAMMQAGFGPRAASSVNTTTDADMMRGGSGRSLGGALGQLGMGMPGAPRQAFREGGQVRGRSKAPSFEEDMTPPRGMRNFRSNARPSDIPPSRTQASTYEEDMTPPRGMRNFRSNAVPSDEPTPGRRMKKGGVVKKKAGGMIPKKKAK